MGPTSGGVSRPDQPRYCFAPSLWCKSSVYLAYIATSRQPALPLVLSKTFVLERENQGEGAGEEGGEGGPGRPARKAKAYEYQRSTMNAGF